MLCAARRCPQQVDEIKSACGSFFTEWQQLLQCVGQIGGRVSLPRFPTADRADTNAQMLGNGHLRMVFAGFIQISKYRVLIAD